LRHVGKLNTRVLYFFVKGRRIVAAHGIRNKAQQIARATGRGAGTQERLARKAGTMKKTTLISI